MNPTAPWTLDADLPAAALRAQGFVRLGAAQLAGLARVPVEAFERWRPGWERLPPDAWLRDGGRYRRRRHGSFVHEPATGRLVQAAHRAHWQPVDYNALHGGIERMFEPLEPALCADQAWSRLLCALGELFESIAPAGRWFVEAHQFRIEAAAGTPGYPTPEGVHHDGVDFVLIAMIARTNLVGGETVIEDDAGNRLAQFVLQDPLDAALVDDPRVKHGVTPVAPADPALPSCRDVLVLTWKRGGAPAA